MELLYRAQALATQAASNAASGVGAGASAGAAAGAAAAGVAAGAAAGAQSAVMAAVAAAGPVQAGMAAVAVTAGRSAAAVGVSKAIVPSPTSNANATVCGLVNPQYKPGKLTLELEGFTTEFDSRQKSLVQNALVDVYNNIFSTCADPYKRQMLNATINQQTVKRSTFNTSQSVLETNFVAWVECDGLLIYGCI